MYSTCLGLILKGYNDYENKRKQFELEFKKVEIPQGLQQPIIPDEVLVTTTGKMEKMKQRKTLKGFMDSFKNGLIDMFKEEEDAKL